jgi:hypothetical protein
VQDLDGQADAGQDIAGMIARLIDPDSAVWMARERAARALELDSPPDLAALAGSSAAALATLGTAWMDGFIAGMLVQHLKTRPQPEAAPE